MRSLVVICVLAALTGCFASSVRDLRSNPGGKIMFETAQNYQVAFRNALDWGRECVQYSSLLAHAEAKGDLYTDRQSGHVTIVAYMPLSTDYWYNVDISANGESAALVEVFYASESMEKRAGKIQGWVENGTGECR